MKRFSNCLTLVAPVLAFAPPAVAQLGPPQLFAPANVPNAQDWRVVFTPDDLSFYLMTERDGHFADTQIYRSTRPDLSGPWSVPQPVTELNTGDQDHIYWMSRDQTEAYMARHGNPVPNTFGDLYRTTRASASDPWGAPTPVAELNTSNFEWHFHLTEDGLYGIFSSNRPGSIGEFDLWQTTRPNTSSPWSSPIMLSNVNSPATERGTFLSADGLTLYFSRLGQGLFRSTRPSLAAPFAPPEFLNVVAGDPTLSIDESTLYFNMPNGSEFNYDVYYSLIPEPSCLLPVIAAFFILRRTRFPQARGH